MITRTPPQKRKHAELIRIKALAENLPNLPLILAFADRLEAEAELEDALAGVAPRVHVHGDYEQIVPVLGRVVYSGGSIKSLDQEWVAPQDSEARRRGIMLTWQWVRSLHIAEAGMCSYFYAGTRDSGPLVCWIADTGHWMRLRSLGNYRRNWACGGNWQLDRVKLGEEPPVGAIPYQGKYVYESFEACNAGLCQEIKDIIAPQQPLSRERIAQARAQLEAVSQQQIELRRAELRERRAKQLIRPKHQLR